MQIRIGEYLLDNKQQILFKGADEVKAEPKILDLLFYLYQHKDRYIPLQELHENVWVGRIVSDTAVRNVVKKLRMVLNDSDLSNSRYIKSVPKRGYKLICDTTFPTEDEDVSQAFDPALSPFTVYEQKDPALSSAGGTQSASLEIATKVSTPPNLVFVLAMIIVTLGLVFTVYEMSKTDSDIDVSGLTISNIADFPGEKYSVAVSKSGAYIAFTGRKHVEENSQVYLLNKSTGEIKQLTKTAKLARHLAFIENDTALVYNDFVYGDMSLHRIDLQSRHYQSTTLLQGIPGIGRMTEGRTGGTLLVSLLTQAQPSIMLYRLNLTSLTLERLTSVTSKDQYHYLISLSPNGEYAATVRKETNGEFISIRRTSDYQEVKSFGTPSPLINVQWFDDETLILLDHQGIDRLDLTSGKRQSLVSKPERIEDFFIEAGSRRLILLESENARAERYFVEKSYLTNGEQEKMFSVSRNVNAMFYIPQLQKLLISRIIEGGFSLGLRDANTRAFEPLYDNKQLSYLGLLDVNSVYPYILMKMDKRLVLFNYQDRQLHFITTANQFVSDAVFTPDGEHLLFGEKLAGKWAIQQQSVSLASAPTTLVKGYKSIRPAIDGYLVTNSQDQLFKINNAFKVAKTFEHFLCELPICRWYVVDNLALWTTTNNKTTFFHSLNYKNNEYRVEEKRRKLFFPSFSVNRENGKYLYLSAQLKTTRLRHYQM